MVREIIKVDNLGQKWYNCKREGCKTLVRGSLCRICYSSKKTGKVSKYKKRI